MLLLDHNISHKLLKDVSIQKLYLTVVHVYSINLHNREDEIIWKYAKKNNMIIVSKDNDFCHISTKKGFPPSIVKISTGNCSTAFIKALLVNNYESINKLREQPGLLIIS